MGGSSKKDVPKVNFFFGVPPLLGGDGNSPSVGSSKSAYIDSLPVGGDLEYLNELNVSYTPSTLTISKSAIEHANRVGIAKSDIFDVVNMATDVEPDHSNPDRRRYSRGGLVVVLSPDGCVLAVFDNRGREVKSKGS